MAASDVGSHAYLIHTGPMLSPGKLADVLSQIEGTLATVARSYYRLVFVVGSADSGKTNLLRELHARTQNPLLNVNLELSERLLDYTTAERARAVPILFQEIIAKAGSTVLLLDNMELLFDAALVLNPLQLLQSNSRNTTLVVTWCGICIDNTLIYAEPGHPEYRKYALSAQDAVLFELK